MDQTEFLLILRESLEGNIPQAELEENITYYREYFESSNCSDTEVCEQLGDPRLIAKSIVEAYLASKGSEAEHYTSKARSEYSRSQSGHAGTEDESSLFERIMHMFILGIGGIVVIFVLLLLLRVALVLVIPVAIVILIWRLIRGN